MSSLWMIKLGRTDEFDHALLVALPLDSSAARLDRDLLEEVAPETAVRRAFSLANSYWSVSVLIPLSAAMALTCMMLFIAAAPLSGDLDPLSPLTWVLSVIALAVASWLLRIVWRFHHNRRDVGAGAAAWAAVARLHGRDPDISGGWRKTAHIAISSFVVIVGLVLFLSTLATLRSPSHNAAAAAALAVIMAFVIAVSIANMIEVFRGPQTTADVSGEPVTEDQRLRAQARAAERDRRRLR